MGLLTWLLLGIVASLIFGTFLVLYNLFNMTGSLVTTMVTAAACISIMGIVHMTVAIFVMRRRKLK
ncbi:uncharacterized protein METZ01_LOCUS308041 [marine metagenome]|uniref:Uncharacterized protein n=1 Tax=marine metagenome TaxID=408172 RepID=A0A382N4S5_9ZZZZ